MSFIAGKSALLVHSPPQPGLMIPAAGLWMQSGGKAGRHTEHLGYLLAEMQFLQRTYPGANW